MEGCHGFSGGRRRATVGAVRPAVLAGSLAVLAGCLAVPAALRAQDGMVTGVVVTDEGQPLGGVSVTVVGESLVGFTAADGGFTIRRVPPGTHVLAFGRIGYASLERTVEVTGDAGPPLRIAMQFRPIPMSEISVTGPSRVPERLLDAPAAVSSVEIRGARSLAITGQPALAIAALPGVDFVQSDVHDININSRGFNTVFARRMLVLQDGRDLAITFLGSQEWLGMSTTLRDMSHIEVVRGPVAALYGANAFAGVVNIQTPPARETPGSTVSVAGGELSTVRVDGRHAGLFGDGRWAYRITGGYSRSDSWARSRTDLGDLSAEYEPALGGETEDVTHPFPGYELRALNGQEKTGPFGLPGEAVGDPDPVVGGFGSVRVDRYWGEDGMLTFEGGAAKAENAVLVGSAARFQVSSSWRPWARVAWSGGGLDVAGWYSGRFGRDEYNLAAGTPARDDAHTFELQAQRDLDFAGGRGGLVLGGSFRNASLDTEGTVLDPRYDARTDRYYALFAQARYDVAPRLRLVGALRYDESDLFAAQVSPRGAIVFMPTSEQALRFTVGRAFEMPNLLDFFVAFPAGPPADFSALEEGLRASPLGPALEDVPAGELFSSSSAVPVLALGNPDLEVEQITSYELGYKAQLGRVFVSADAYYSIMDGFVTDVLPGVNPTFGPWSAPETVPETAREAVEGAVSETLAGVDPLAAAGLTRLEDGTTAIVLSIGNAGRAKVRGIELGTSVRLSREVDVDLNYTFFDFDLDASTLVPGDVVLPNTPKHKGNVALRYRGHMGLDATLRARFTDAYRWSAGTFTGPVPAAQTIDIAAGYRIGPNLRLELVGTNLLDQQRYHSFGGAVIGRRVLGGVTATF